MSGYKFKIGGWGSKPLFFETISDIVSFLKKRYIVEEFEYSLDDIYEAVNSIGYPFPYWEKGERKSLREWLDDARRQLKHTKEQSDLEMIYYILNRENFWKKL